MSNSTSPSKGSSPPSPSKSSSPPSESDSSPPPPRSNSPPPSPPTSSNSSPSESNSPPPSPPTSSNSSPSESNSPPPSPPTSSDSSPSESNSPPPSPPTSSNSSPSESNSPPPSPPTSSNSSPSESNSPPPSPPTSSNSSHSESNSPPPSPPTSSNSSPPESNDSPPPPKSPPPSGFDNGDNSPPPPPSKSNSPPPPSQPPPSPPTSTPSPPNNQAPSPNLSPPANVPPASPTGGMQSPPSSDSPPISGSPPTSRMPPKRGSPPTPATPGESPPQTNSPKQQPPSFDNSSKSANTGLIVGLAVAGVVLVLILILCMIRILTRKRKIPTLDYRGPPTISVQADGNYYRQVSPMGFSGQSDSYISQGHSGPASGIMGGGSNNYGYSGQMEPVGGKSWFSYEELLEVTSGFSRENMIGEGGFGCVYKGTLADGRRVAVKNLKAGSGQGEREFRAEVEIISRVHHRHLVSLVGYCIAEDHRLLVYEFLSNNTLEHHLHGTPVMDWPKRMRIAIGSAKGLAYLHEDCHPRIIHRDIKSANILLEDSFEPQVADFGLAKLSNDTHTHVSTRVMGTFGYMAPEYASSGKLTDRSDVFSFGVVLLEIITGRKPVDTSRPLGDESLVEWARPLLVRALETGNCDDLVDPRLEGNYNRTEMFNMIEAAAACVRHSAPRRPRMVQVLRALDSQDDMLDLSNGVKYGQSHAFNPGPPTADIQRFRRLALGSNENNSFNSEEYDRRSAAAFSGENRSREQKPTWRRAADQSSGELESDTRAMFWAEKSTGGRNHRRGFS